MDYVIIRPPLVFGPGVRANFFQLIKIVCKNYPLPFAMIDNMRSFIYVHNLVDILLKCIDSKNVSDKTYLVKDIDLSTPALTRAIGKALKQETRIFPVPIFMLKLVGMITGKKSSIDRLTESLIIDDAEIRKDLNWEPPVDLNIAMRETIIWYREHQADA